MIFLTVIFWASLLVVFYSYLGYPLLLFCIVRYKRFFFKERLNSTSAYQPDVVLIIPAYNEEEIIPAKIANTLELNYPKEKLSVIFITDGSTDQSPLIISKYNEFRLMHQPERKGKPAAMNRAIKETNAPIVIFCDANTLLNKESISEIVKHYINPIVGGVSGEKKIHKVAGDTAVSAGEGLYWKYESFIKKMDAEFYSVVGAAGELFSIRKELYEPIEENTIIEDFVVSLRVCLKGYVVRYEPLAYAMETSSVSMRDEQQRKVRISAGAFQAMWMLKPLFNIFKYPKLSFQFISHRVLRWAVCPLCLVIIFISNLWLAYSAEGEFFTYVFFTQITFYAIAILGLILARFNVKNKFLYIPYYFLFMNMAVFIGFHRIITKGQSVLWQKATRQAL